MGAEYGGMPCAVPPYNSTSLVASNVFVHPNIGAAFSTSEDWRLCTIALCGHTSPAIGAGTNFTVPSAFATLDPGNDILGQSRVSRIDLGAVQAQESAPPAVVGEFFVS